MRNSLHTFAIVKLVSVMLFALSLTGAGLTLVNAATTNEPTGSMSSSPLAPTSHFIAIAAGEQHTCAVTNTAGVMCWGKNDKGQLGDGTHEQRDQPVSVVGLTSGATGVSAGKEHSCAIISGGVKCWGYGTSGQLGNGQFLFSDTPVTVLDTDGSTPLSNITAIASGRAHTCAVTSGGAVKCWGYNNQGQLGNGSTSNSNIAVNVSGLSSGVSAIAAGDLHTCAVVSGAAQCWGDNTFGQLGDGNTFTFSSTPVSVSSLLSVTAIAGGGSHSCAVASGGAKCWGDNTYGQLGNNSFTPSPTPVNVSNLTSGVSNVATGNAHSCALLNTGAVRCWGYNAFGQLGNNATTDSSVPVTVTSLSGVTLLTSHNFHNCALTGGYAYCWGDNQYGQLGDATSAAKRTPQQVIGLASNVLTISVGTTHACAITTTANALCWGKNLNGQIGNGFGGLTAPDVLTPVKVINLSNATALAAGGQHSCARTTSGSVLCWGYNNYGQVGNGSSFQTAVTLPTTVLNLSNAIAVAAGHDHSCAITTTNGARCWGYNLFGSLGDGTNSNRSQAVDVSGLSSGVTALAAGDYHTCAIVSGGLRCWGYNSNGQVGDNSTVNRTAPVNVSGLSSGVTAVAGGSLHTCAVVSGEVQCWGDNTGGQLGTTTVSESHVPIAVSGVSNATALALGDSHSCALINDGTVKCWGNNDNGQLGNGTTLSSTTPVNVTGLSGVVAIEAGGSTTCVLLNTGALKCWGSNSDGQVGDGVPTYRTTPVQVYDPFTPLPPDLIIAKDDGRTVADVGDVLTYTLTFTNIGGTTATGVVITETLPPSTTFVGPSGWQLVGGNVYTRFVGVLTAAVKLTTTFSVQVTGVPASERYTNTVSIGASNETDFSNNQATDVNTTPPPPNLTIGKNDGRSVVYVGDLLTYTIAYANTGGSTALTIILTETLPNGTAFVGPANWALVSGNTYTRTVSNLPAGQVGATTIVISVTSIPADRIYTNTVSIGASNETNFADNQATDVDTAPPPADLIISKDDGRATADVGDVLTYTIAYTNSGGLTATNIVLTETLPNNTLFIGAGWTLASGNTYTLSVADLPASQAASATFVVSVTAVPVEQRYTNTVQISSPDEVNTTNNQATDVDASPPPPDLVISKDDGRLPVIVGDVLTYTISYTNVGGSTARNVVLTETLPNDTAFVGPASWLQVGASNVYTLSVANLLSGQSASVTFVVSVTGAPADGLYTNTVDIAASNEFTLTNNQALDVDRVPLPPDVTISKDDGRATVSVGEVVTYTIVYTNIGDQTATNIVLTETLPVSMTFVGPVTWTQVSANEFTLALSDLAGQQQGSAIFVAQITGKPVEERYTNTVQIDASNDTNTSNNQASDVDVSPPPPDLVIGKSDGRTTVNVGDIVTYTIVYTNIGGSTASGIVLTETLPAEMTYVGTNGWLQVGASHVYTIAVSDVPLGQNATVIFAAQIVASAASGLYTNQVDIIASTEITLTNNTATDVDTLTPADLQVSIADGVSFPVAGQALVYTIIYTNASSGDAANALLIITLPIGINYVSGSWLGSGNVLTLPLGALNSGASGMATLNAQVDPNIAGDNVLTATVSIIAAGLEANPADNTANDVDYVAPANLQLWVDDGVSSVKPNDTLIYTIVVKNVGNATAANAVVTFTLSPFVSIVSAAGWTATGTTYSQALPPIPPGQAVTVTLSAQVNGSVGDGTPITHAPFVTANPEFDATNNTFNDVDFVQTTGSADVQIVGASAWLAISSGSSTLVLTLTNSGTFSTTTWFYIDAYIDYRPQNRLDLGMAYAQAARANEAARIRHTLRVQELGPSQMRVMNFNLNLPIGAHQLYLQADTCDIASVGATGNCFDRSYGRLIETNENNNIFGPITVNVIAGNVVYLPLVVR
jgi:uncharacterized repeat protein (TIGR01451 family)